MSFFCTKCDQAFDAEEPRCPACLRKSTVVPADQRRAAEPRARVSGRSLLLGPGMLVTLAIVVPYATLNALSWRLPWPLTFLVALLGFGAGNLVNWLWNSRDSG